MQLTSETVTLPTGRIAVVREMTGREEDILTNEKYVTSGRSIDMLLENVILKLDDEKPTATDVEQMISADRISAVLASRRLTHGDMVESEHECRQCKKKFVVEVDLSTIETTPAPANLEQTLTLTGGTRVVIRPLIGADERRLVALQRNGQDLMTGSMLIRIKEVEGVNANQLRPWLQNLSMRDRTAIRNALKGSDFGPDTSKRIDCPSCNHENQFEVTSLSGFFFPDLTRE